ncbi:MAG: hypothetical protein PHV32_01005 [Eubacteriales bacterium]|nr:hypothetical protein [Eubacteriales bacterium]
MNLTIKPLTNDLTPAYLDFFDNCAFSDNNPMGPCYCTVIKMYPSLPAKTPVKTRCRWYALPSHQIIESSESVWL